MFKALNFLQKEFSSEVEINRAGAEKWRHLKKDRHIVHSLTIRGHGETSPLLYQNAENLFASWDIISASLITFRDMNKFKQRHVSKEWIRGGCFGDINFVLKVPPQNILGAFTKDIWFPNHAGVNKNTREVINPNALTDAIFNGYGVRRQRLVSRYNNNIPSPSQLLSETKLYNEILLIGRSNINYHKGLPATNRIKVLGIYIAPADKSISADYRKYIPILKNNNPGVPVDYID